MSSQTPAEQDLWRGLGHLVCMYTISSPERELDRRGPRGVFFYGRTGNYITVRTTGGNAGMIEFAQCMQSLIYV